MICPPCTHAGNLLAAGNTQAAENNHNLCRRVQAEFGNTWCDCQHKLGKLVNYELLKETASGDQTD